MKHLKKSNLDALHFFSSASTPHAFMLDHFDLMRAEGWTNTLVVGGGIFCSKLQDKGFSLIVGPFSRTPGFVQSIRAVLFTASLIRRNKDAMVVTHTPIASLYVAIASFVLRRKFVFYCHGFVSAAAGRSLKNRAYAMLERFTCKASYATVFVSPSLCRFAVENGYIAEANAISLTGSISGVEKIDVTSRRALKKEVRLGFLGRVSRDKGIFDCLNVLSLLESRGVNACLLVAGAIEDEAFRSRVLGCKNIEYLGHLDAKGKASFFNNIDLILCPSVREGFGMAALEASAYGVPVIGYDIVGLKDAVASESTGLLLPVGDVNGLADAVVRYMEDPTLYVQHSAAAIERASNIYQREKIVREHVDTLNKLANDVL